MKIKLVLPLFLFMLCFIQACSRKAEDPPRDRIETVLALFDSLDRKDYSSALEKIRRLRNEDKTNIFLPELENVVRENLIIAKASEEIRSGNRKKAGEILLSQDRRLKNGSIVNAQNTVRRLMLLEKLSEEISLAESASVLDQSTEQFIKTACLLKERGNALILFAEEARKKLPAMENREKGLSLFDIAADEAILLNSGDLAAPSVKAMLEVEKLKTESEK